MQHPHGQGAGRRRHRLATTLVLALVVGAPGAVASAEGEEPAGAAGPTFRDAELGLTVVGPKGWKLNAEGSGPSEWTRLATWLEPDTDAEAVLSARRRTSADVQALLARVRLDWASSREITVTGTRAVPPSPTDPIGQVVLDATYVVRPKPEPGSPPGVTPPPIPWRVRATYWLAPRGEVLLYAKARQTHWSRFESSLRTLEGSMAFAASGAPEGPKGSGVFRDEKNGFACKYPEGYTVSLPALRNHIVQFASVDVDAPAFDVYVLSWDRSAEDDVRRLEAFYRDEQAAETTTEPLTVVGQEATRLEARARIGGRDLLLLTVVFKRGSDRLYRLKATGPAAREAELRQGLEAFLGGFELIKPSR
ncbi:MAG: hypothetical protein AB7T63_14295 [Planctomycetota bacterium]